MSNFQFSLIPVMVALALAGASQATRPVWAQGQADEHAATTVSIAAQPLGLALNELARQVGLQVMYAPDMVEGLRAPAVNGALSVQQALQRLLAGSGLTASVQGRRILVRRQASGPADQAQASGTLSAITIRANREPTVAEQAATSYTVRRSSNATKLDLTIKETPQSLTIFTQKQIEDQNLFQVADILRNTPGVSVQQFGVPGAGRATFYSRGYAINNYQIDGMPTSAGMFGGSDLLTSMDTALYERVEIIRGSTGLTSGSGDPSASINFVRKRPGYKAQRKLNLSYGSYARRRAEADLSQPFNESGSLRGRVVAVAAEGNHWMERVHEKTRMFYGIVEADVTDNTTLALGYTRFGRYVDDATPHGSSLRQGTGSVYEMFQDKGRNFNSATQWSYAKQDTRQIFIDARHHFNDNWTLSAAYQYTHSTPDRVYGMLGVDYYNPVTSEASLSYGRVQSDYKVDNLDVTLLGKFQLWGRDAQIAVGLNGYQAKTDSPLWYTDDYTWLCRAQTSIGLDNWNNGDIAMPTCRGAYLVDLNGPIYARKEKQYGAFLSTKLKPLEDLTLILGARLNRYNLTLYGYTADRSADLSGYPTKVKQPSRIIPYAGIIYDLTPTVSAYASYTGIHKNQELVQGVTEQEYSQGTRFRMMPAREGNTIELGVKSALFDDRLNLHAAVFRMRERNVPYMLFQTTDAQGNIVRLSCSDPFSNDACNPVAPTDGPTLSGLELSIAGQIGDNWMINAGYAYLHLKSYDYRTYIPPTYDDVMTTYDFNRPKHTFSLFASYKFNEHFTLGGGMRWKSRTWQRTTNAYTGVNYDFSQSSFAVYDLMARYEINKHATLGINVENLFDKVYFANNMSSYYGSPRSITASLNLKF